MDTLSRKVHVLLIFGLITVIFVGTTANYSKSEIGEKMGESFEVPTSPNQLLRSNYYQSFVKIGGSSGDFNVISAQDSIGDIILAGTTDSSDFPVVSPFQSSLNGSRDSFILKLATNGSILWSTYFGGKWSDYITDIEVDGDNNIIIAGYTDSLFIPSGISVTDQNNAFLAKISPSGELVWKVDILGSNIDIAADISISQDGDIFIAGMTKSNNFQVQDGYDTTFNGVSDGFLMRFQPNGTLVWSTFLGGSGFEIINAVELDDSGNVWITGETESGDFPTTTNATKSAYADVFVAQLTADGRNLLWSSYFGGSSTDKARDIKKAPSGNMLVIGSTYSSDFPTKGSLDDSIGGAEDIFVFNLTTKGELIWSRYLGGRSNDSPHSLNIRSDGTIVIPASTNSQDFPILRGYNQGFTGNSEVVISMLDPSGEQIWSSFFGGSDYEWSGGAIDQDKGTMWILGDTTSADFDLGTQQGPGGSSDVFVMRIVEPLGDLDGDGMDNSYEVINGLDYTVDDSALDLDGDGLSNIDEYKRGTRADVVDTDGDGMPDKWEVDNGMNPVVDDAGGDSDSDGLTNIQEYRAETDPNNADTDGDKIPDGYEVSNNLDPLNSSDTNADYDGDGLSNFEEYELGTNPWKEDTDADGMPDKYEIEQGLNPLDPLDANKDPDDDGLSNREEYEAGTDPNWRDTDEDGMPDGWEVENNLDPLNDKDAIEDPDGDGYNNLYEYNHGMNPHEKDIQNSTTNENTSIASSVIVTTLAFVLWLRKCISRKRSI